MDVADFRRMFQYDRWANQEVAQALASNANAPAKSLRWMAHVIAAEALWLARIEKRPAPMPVWPQFSATELVKQMHATHDAWRQFLGRADGASLAATCAYTNSKGEAYTSTIADIMTHVLTHSTYHRGQVAADMRASGVEPVYTDFIHAVRQGKLDGF